jgi:4-amino-4-deoxychorismate lyase
MRHFLETICIRDGVIQHLEWHQRRVDVTLKHFYPGHQLSWSLENSIIVPSEFQLGVIRCRITYDAHLLAIHYFPYEPRLIQTLKLMEAPPDFDYRYKFADRNVLDNLFAQRDSADDILIMKNGWITDTSVANIAFQKRGIWYSPSLPLLTGTTWKRLVFSGKIIVCPIHWTQLSFYETFRIFNAMNEWDSSPERSIKQIG